MTIKEMNDVLKEMKKVCAFKDGESDICVRTANDPQMFSDNAISVKTKIGEINVDLYWRDNSGVKKFKNSYGVEYIDERDK